MLISRPLAIQLFHWAITASAELDCCSGRVSVYRADTAPAGVLWHEGLSDLLAKTLALDSAVESMRARKSNLGDRHDPS